MPSEVTEACSFGLSAGHSSQPVAVCGEDVLLQSPVWWTCVGAGAPHKSLQVLLKQAEVPGLRSTLVGGDTPPVPFPTSLWSRASSARCKGCLCTEQGGSCGACWALLAEVCGRPSGLPPSEQDSEQGSLPPSAGGSLSPGVFLLRSLFVFSAWNCTFNCLRGSLPHH